MMAQPTYTMEQQEVEGVLTECQFAVTSITYDMVEQLLHITTLEDEQLDVEWGLNGFTCNSKTFETITALLMYYSPLFQQEFHKQLIYKLSLFKETH